MTASGMGRRIAVAGPAVLVLGAAIPPLRPAVAIVLALGWGGLWLRGRPEALAWAATIPVSIAMVWPWVLGSDSPLGTACTGPLSEIVVRRAALALAVLGSTAVLASVNRVPAGVTAIRVPSRLEAAVAVAGVAVVAVGGLVVGPLLARPFFGDLEFARPVGAVTPAVVFGLSNGVLEELAYRGVLQGWLGVVLGRWAGIGIQALVFGLLHAGPEVVALLPLHVALLGGAGLVAGLIVDRTRSLAIPVGIHVGADIALYFGLACRPV